MSMNFVLRYGQALFRPFQAARNRQKGAQAERTPLENAERLERIAVYARAGYFNMGYTFDMFHVIGEISPD
ncbi:hypothetical protein [Paraburkholderia saeva]|uniref:hypothetical protein n=1 Tax=Paraburkholderia saeva TaxID=2777537 RepID=UPI001DB37E54|nr:hypothetical protein [Paraburkholderia saeva]CAG4904129.1 hypothetical protein R52603_03169 [Paraburkholderia saeva]